VDIALYDADGKLLAKTQQGQATNEGSQPKLITIEGDVKIVVDPECLTKEIRFTAYGNGTMTYTVQDIDKITGAVKQEKVFRDVALVPGKEMRCTVVTATTGITLQVTVNGTDTAEIKADGSETKYSTATPEAQNSFFDVKGQGSGQSAPPKTGEAVNWKMVALWVVILLDVAFMVWIVQKNNRQYWPKRMRPTMDLQLPELE